MNAVSHLSVTALLFHALLVAALLGVFFLWRRLGALGREVQILQSRLQLVNVRELKELLAAMQAVNEQVKSRASQLKQELETKERTVNQLVQELGQLLVSAERLHKALLSISDDVRRGTIGGGPAGAHALALEMARQGADAQTISRQFELSLGEAELLEKLARRKNLPNP